MNHLDLAIKHTKKEPINGLLRFLGRRFKPERFYYDFNQLYVVYIGECRLELKQISPSKVEADINGEMMTLDLFDTYNDLVQAIQVAGYPKTRYYV